ncbi:class II glutamine amidotransferase [Gryllotalpicola ginsengisoli]|uniref:class II glutamine amidotransferase n=1 Tax=Gryllotalpicola ginsengisoli TaxID=444608 RepID=UPI0003B3DE26|nr:class II glutamine amidotransferase [Gryllotalpicola ginsengisoli]
MCRLLAYAAPSPVSAAAALGESQAAVFRDMAELHDDGWGTAWVSPQTGAVEAYRTTDSGFENPELARALGDASAAARIVHLRLATEGLACTIGNTHPFTADGMAFAHNGGLVPADELLPLISPEVAATLQGDTDSERYFAVIRSRIAAGLGAADAAAAAVRELRPLFPRASLNALLLTPTELVAVHASQAAPIPHDMLDASGLERLPADHRTAYYQMHERRLPDGTVLFASTGLDVADWTPLPAETVAAVDLATLEVSYRPIAAEAYSE